MTTSAKLRREKSHLNKGISKCKQYRELVSKNLRALSKDYREGKLTRDEYHNKVNYGLNGESFKHYLGLYDDYIGQYKRKIFEIDNNLSKKNYAPATVIIFLILLSTLLTFNPGITGFVVFSEIEKGIFESGELYEKSTTINLTPKTNRVSTIMISGEYIGEGKLMVILDTDKESFLIYSTEKEGEFNEICGSACYLNELSSKYKLRIEIEGGKLILDKVDYSYFELREFTISEKEMSYELEDNRYIKNKFRIENKRGELVKLVVYGEGELSEFLTLNSSYVEINSSADIRYDIDLPFDITPGEYSEDIVVRYVPKGEFTGKTPTEKHKINVVVKGKKENNWIYYLLGGLGVIMLVNLFLYIRRKNSKIVDKHLKK